MVVPAATTVLTFSITRSCAYLDSFGNLGFRT